MRRPRELQTRPILNATTSRTKTLIPLRSVQRLHALTPRFDEVRALCDALDSTGLYPFAVECAHPLDVHARQFPRASGYPEDAATGIAAAALLYGAVYYGLLASGASGASGAPGVTVHQGYALGKPSCICVEPRDPDDSGAGCWISGTVDRMTLAPLP
ncbi:PhzF family phenazine biosynthesis protein [Paraburkholderia phymatum]|uniref:PhzF family phenazine biosynthesis protein n=1 Tax=Paraburkholderia phymatum TaxID=148447 RepID=A0ACC6U4C1_9BURK